MKLSKPDYVALARFRAELRRFLHFADTGARAAGVTAQQHQLLLAIKGRPGRDWATAGELAEALLLRHHSVVGMVDRCARLGLVERRPSAQDRRAVEIHLTRRGLGVLDRVSSRNRRELDGLRRSLGFVRRRYNPAE